MNIINVTADDLEKHDIDPETLFIPANEFSPKYNNILIMTNRTCMTEIFVSINGLTEEYQKALDVRLVL